MSGSKLWLAERLPLLSPTTSPNRTRMNCVGVQTLATALRQSTVSEKIQMQVTVFLHICNTIVMIPF